MSMLLMSSLIRSIRLLFSIEFQQAVIVYSKQENAGTIFCKGKYLSVRSAQIFRDIETFKLFFRF